MDELLMEGTPAPALVWVEHLNRLSAGFVFGIAIAAIAAFSHYRQKTFRTSFLAMLVLMTVLIAMVTLVIGKNVARAFSLAGVLAIIRFRTVIDDTRDTAYVIAAVAMGLAAGAGFYLLAVLTLPFILATTWIFRTSRSVRKSNELIGIRLATTEDPQKILEPIFAKYLHQSLLVSLDKNGKGTFVDLQYAIRLKEGALQQEMMVELQHLACVLRVKLKQRRES